MFNDVHMDFQLNLAPPIQYGRRYKKFSIHLPSMPLSLEVMPQVSVEIGSLKIAYTCNLLTFPS